MPVFRYECPNCERRFKKITPKKDTPVNCIECEAVCKRLMPRTMAPSVMETVDKERNIKQVENQDERVKRRAKEYFVEHEVEDLIAKHGEEEARKMGWIKDDGTVITKNDIK